MLKREQSKILKAFQNVFDITRTKIEKIFVLKTLKSKNLNRRCLKFIKGKSQETFSVSFLFE